MKIHRDLTITGSLAALKRVLANMEQLAAPGWARDQALEEKIGSSVPMYCFVCNDTSKHRAAAVWLAFRNDTQLYVSTVGPLAPANMGIDECNAVLVSFHARVVEPAADHEGVDVAFTAGDVDLDEWLTKETAKKLRDFSRGANTAGLHPLDRQRWMAFLIGAHLERARFPADQLEQWLRDEAEWEDEAASRLADEYEHARALLRAFDKEMKD